MSEENDKDLERTQELYDFLQGRAPFAIKNPDGIPRLTPEQAWTVIWYLGNQHWQVTDRVDRCGVCGALYHSWQEGECLDFGKAPYHFCDDCMTGEEANKKRRLGRRLEDSKRRAA